MFQRILEFTYKDIGMPVTRVRFVEIDWNGILGMRTLNYVMLVSLACKIRVGNGGYNIDRRKSESTTLTIMGSSFPQTSEILGVETDSKGYSQLYV